MKEIARIRKNVYKWVRRKQTSNHVQIREKAGLEPPTIVKLFTELRKRGRHLALTSFGLKRGARLKSTFKCTHRQTKTTAFPKVRLYRSMCCVSCLVRGRCTRNKRGQYMFRGEFDGAVDRLRARLATSEGKVNCRLQRMLAEHPFGTIKRAFNQGYLLLKGLRKVRGEVGFTMLAYNMRRAINILGVGMLINLMKRQKREKQAKEIADNSSDVKYP